MHDEWEDDELPPPHQGATEAFGIHPPHSVEITSEGRTHQWPHDMVSLAHDHVVISDAWTAQKILTYPFVDRHRRDDGSWEFVGPEHDFTVKPGPVAPPSMQ